MADVEVEVAVAVEVGEGRRGRPVAVAAQPGAVGDVLERPVAPVAIERVRSPAGEEQVGVAVVVDSRRRPRRGRSRAAARRCPTARSRPRTCRRPGCGRGGRRCSGDSGLGRELALPGRVDVEPAVAVVVEQADPAAHGLGDLVESLEPVVEREAQAGRLGVVDEPGARAAGSGRRAASLSDARLDVQLGEQAGGRQVRGQWPGGPRLPVEPGELRPGPGRPRGTARRRAPTSNGPRTAGRSPRRPGPAPRHGRAGRRGRS